MPPQGTPKHTSQCLNQTPDWPTHNLSYKIPHNLKYLQKNMSRIIVLCVDELDWINTYSSLCILPLSIKSFHDSNIFNAYCTTRNQISDGLQYFWSIGVKPKPTQDIIWNDNTFPYSLEDSLSLEFWDSSCDKAIL